MHRHALHTSVARLAARLALAAAVSLPLAAPVAAQSWRDHSRSNQGWPDRDGYNRDVNAQNWAHRCHAEMRRNGGHHHRHHAWHQGQGMGQHPMAHRRWAMRHGRLANAVDSNHNGRISAAEAASFADRIFTRLDDNGDNRLTRSEFLAPHWPPGRNRQAAAQRRREHFDAMDRNGNGRIGYREFMTWHLARYRAADLNTDGQIDPWELRTAVRLGRTRS